MTYAPPPYQQAGYASADPTNVMGRRIGAYLFDGLVVVPFVVLLIVRFSNEAEKRTVFDSTYCTNYNNSHTGSTCIQFGSKYAYVLENGAFGRVVGLALLLGLIVSLNQWVLQGITGATIGKYLFGLRVIRADGRIVPFGWNLLRTLLFVVDGFCFGMVGLITALVTHPHRRVGDMAAGTFVVGKDSVGRPIAAAPTTYVPYAPPPQAPVAGGFAPGTYGTSHPPGAQPAPNQPAAAEVPRWGTPMSAPAPAPAATEPPGWAAPTADNGGWTPTPPTVQQPAPQAAPPPQASPAPAPTQPQWDQARNAWIVWDPSRGAWLQWDANANQWGAIS